MAQQNMVKAFAYKQQVYEGGIAFAHDMSMGIECVFVPEYKIEFNSQGYAYKQDQLQNKRWTEKRFDDNDRNLVHISYETNPAEEIEVPLDVVLKYVKLAELDSLYKEQQDLCKKELKKVFPIKFKTSEVNQVIKEKETVPRSQANMSSDY